MWPGESVFCRPLRGLDLTLCPAATGSRHVAMNCRALRALAEAETAAKAGWLQQSKESPLHRNLGAGGYDAINGGARNIVRAARDAA